ncbi:enolase C-terminal domain-like protein [Paenibacillus whitsoniae]|uniref:L-alanine-DL-glutamate epimerase n=1 Tax=Paenibacillus whitsoniae TaxID=2496558 RepID=A0A430J7N9_9BACL|nr:enolase C-terminal domain-like protein [Paenibacillus whitsoniae]RTE05521.1 L-alanine-DL-glutamate epimerase [Paenibacillus whitsoniae]
MIKIAQAALAVEKEPLLYPFGFKGGSLSELWQTMVGLQSENGHTAVGLGIQSVLWSDPGVFFSATEQAGNEQMLAITHHALAQTRGAAFSTPLELSHGLRASGLASGREVTGRAELRETFALNALVPLDHAAWLLYARETGREQYDAMLPEPYRELLSYRNAELGLTPVVGYGQSLEDIRGMLDQGYFVLKIKIGSDPDKDGDLSKMLAWDMQRLTEIHALAAERTTPYTDSGRILYYLDANGRYDTMDRLLRFLDHADRIGALARIVLLEEPFPEENKNPVHAAPVRVTADESVHGVEDAIERIALGYGAITLKPIAKTLSVALEVAQAALTRGVPCLCADLTVNPWMLDWNKNLAARLAPLPGLKVGILESNGHQNYAHWARMQGYHPEGRAPWTQSAGGVYTLGDDFYARSGGSFGRSSHYEAVLAEAWG